MVFPESFKSPRLLETKKDTGTVKATETPASTKPSSTPAASKPSSKPTEEPKQEAAHTHTWVQQYKTERVPAKTHVVHHDAEYKTVTDRAAYDERVLVKDAYDETVVDSPETTKQVPNGYKCSGCGATK